MDNSIVTFVQTKSNACPMVDSRQSLIGRVATTAQSREGAELPPGLGEYPKAAATRRALVLQADEVGHGGDEPGLLTVTVLPALVVLAFVTVLATLCSV